ncbi:MAG: porin [Aquificota bacterium]|nr:porin [Aquificota bacterium]
MLAVSDGSTIEKVNRTGSTNVTSEVNIGNFIGARVEVSPPGFTERKKDDTGIGEKNKGNVISLGLSYARNTNFSVDSVRDEEASLWGADLFIRFGLGPGKLVAQGEYISMDYSKIGKSGKGWYVQGGYLFRLVRNIYFEPALRYEKATFNGEDQYITTAGFNNYLKGHKVKWAYNILFIKKGNESQRTVHQIQAQIYF